MRVLILTPDIYTRGGIARYTATLASALADLIEPANVHVLPLLDTGGAEVKLSGYRILDPVATRLSTAAKFGFASKALRLGFHRYGLVISTHIGFSPVAAMVRLLYGTPFWVTCHGSEAWARFPADVRWGLKRAGMVLPVSRFTAERVAKVNGIPQSRIRVLHNAIPEEFARRLMAADGGNSSAAASGWKGARILSVGTVSRESSYKGHDTVIKAMPRVLAAVPGAHYVVVGGGDDFGRLRRLAREAGVEDRIVFKGGVTDAELADCYRSCDVFALPSRTARANGKGWVGEGFGRVYVEASLAGKPVVGSTGGGAMEAVLHRKTGLLVDPESVADVADALIYFLRNRDEAARMGREGRRWALENFTVGMLRRRLAELLKARGFSAHAEVAENGARVLALDTPKAIQQASGRISWR